MAVLDESIISDVLQATKEERKIIKKHCKELNQELSKCDRAISDILHDLELSKLDAIEMTQDVKLLQKILRRRRIIKDTILPLQHILQQNRNKQIITRAKQVTPHYTPRELIGLKVAELAR